jgi:CRP-like cAMP-binding protein
MNLLSAMNEALTVARGTRLVESGVIPQGLIILNSGTAETTVSVAGREKSLGIAGPGRVFALHSTITGRPPETTVTCLEESQITVLPKDVFLQLLARHPEMYFAVIKVLSADLTNAHRGAVAREEATVNADPVGTRNHFCSNPGHERFLDFVAQRALASAERGRSRMHRTTLNHEQKEIESWSAS